ncbi:hypothetical protein J5751_04915 [bacterium]|nr:hypothetical protein [bacterium]
MRKRKESIKAISIILLIVLLTSCKNKIYTACPDVIEYSKDFQYNLAEDLKKEESYFIKQAILDYFNLREKIKICND